MPLLHLSTQWCVPYEHTLSHSHTLIKVYHKSYDEEVMSMDEDRVPPTVVGQAPICQGPVLFIGPAPNPTTSPVVPTTFTMLPLGHQVEPIIVNSAAVCVCT